MNYEKYYPDENEEIFSYEFHQRLNKFEEKIKKVEQMKIEIEKLKLELKMQKVEIETYNAILEGYLIDEYLHKANPEFISKNTH